MHSKAGMPESTYSLYILECADGTLYTGIATDVARRLAEHRDGRRGAKYLRGRGPHQLLLCIAIGSRSDAQRAEIRIKQLSRRDKLRVVEGTLDLEDILGYVPVDASVSS